MAATVTLMPGFEVGQPSALSRHVQPRMQVVPPTGNLPGPMTPMPTSSQSNKKTNAAIVYTRVVSDASRLTLQTGQAKSSYAEGFLVFIKGRSMDSSKPPLVNSLESAHSILCSLESVNAELVACGKINYAADMNHDITSWKLDGIFKGADLEIGSAPVNSNSAILVTIAGPTIVKNIFVAQPQHGDMLYIGLVDAATKDGCMQWVPFSSQDLVQLSKGSTAPSAPRTGAQWQQAKTFPYAGAKTQTHPSFHPTDEFHRHKFTKDDAEHLLLAYRIGRIVDSNHAPGEVRVNVQIQPVSVVDLGLAYDAENTAIEFKIDRDTNKQTTTLPKNESYIGRNARKWTGGVRNALIEVGEKMQVNAMSVGLGR